MQFGSKKQVDVARLKADLAAAGVEVLSAQCATDRVRLQYSLQDILNYGERNVVKKAAASADVLHRFFSQLEEQLRRQDSDR